MLGDLIYEEKGTSTGIRVLSSEGGEVEVEVNLKTEDLGVEETSLWTYTSKTRADGSIYGEGTGFMTTQDGATIHLHAQGAAKATSDGSVANRGALYFQTTAEKLRAFELHLGRARIRCGRAGKHRGENLGVEVTALSPLVVLSAASGHDFSFGSG